MMFLNRLWTFLKSPTSMALVTFFSIALAVYLGFFYEKRGNVAISMDAFSRVFDIHQPIGNLEISYAGKNLRTEKKTLWSTSFTIKNTGNAEIKKGDFDDLVPLGLQFTGAEVVETPTIKTNVNYLAKQLKIVTKDNMIWLSPVILESGDEVQISALLLGSDAEKPTISPIGKIAGIKTIEFFDLDKKASGKSAWAMITDAESEWVHPARLVVYLLGPPVAITFLLAIPTLLLVLPFQYIIGRFKRSKRGKYAVKFRKARTLTETSKKLLDKYVEEGESFLKTVNWYAFKLKLRNKLVAAIKDRVDEDQLKQIIRSTLTIFTGAGGFQDLTKAGLVVGDGPTITLVDGCAEANKEIADFMEIDLPTEEHMQKVDEEMSAIGLGMREPNTEFFKSKT